MTLRFDAHVETRGGVCDLGRVVGVMALLDLTPLSLTVEGDTGGLRIDIHFAAERREAELCLASLQALVSVTSATVRTTAQIA